MVADGSFTETGMLENIAQTCALRMGYMARYVNMDDNVGIGYIASIDRTVVHGVAQVGDTITTHVSVVAELGGMQMVEAQVRRDDTLLMETKMKLVVR